MGKLIAPADYGCSQDISETEISIKLFKDCFARLPANSVFQLGRRRVYYE